MLLNVKLDGREVKVEINDIEFAREFNEHIATRTGEGYFCQYCMRRMDWNGTSYICNWCKKDVENGEQE